MEKALDSLALLQSAAAMKQYSDKGNTVLSNEKANAADLIAHTSDKQNPHNVTKNQVGLGNVNNTSDQDKPVSTAVSALVNNTRDSLESLVDAKATKVTMR